MLALALLLALSAPPDDVAGTDPLLGWKVERATKLRLAQPQPWGTSRPVGAAAFLRDADGTYDIFDNAGNLESQIVTENGATETTCLRGNAASGGVLCAESQASIGGVKTNRGAGETAFSVADTYTSVGSRTLLWSVLGGGQMWLIAQQAVTIANDGAGTTPTDTTTPTAGRVDVTCNDPNNCNYNPGETSVADGVLTEICNVGGANNVVVNDVNDVVAIQGAAAITLTPIVSATSGGDCSSCSYNGTIWSCRP